MHLDLPSMLYTNQYNRSRAGRLVVIHLSLLFIDRVEPVIIAAADTASADTASAHYDLSMKSGALQARLRCGCVSWMSKKDNETNQTNQILIIQSHNYKFTFSNIKKRLVGLDWIGWLEFKV